MTISRWDQRKRAAVVRGSFAELTEYSIDVYHLAKYLLEERSHKASQEEEGMLADLARVLDDLHRGD